MTSTLDMIHILSSVVHMNIRGGEILYFPIGIMIWALSMLIMTQIQYLFTSFSIYKYALSCLSMIYTGIFTVASISIPAIAILYLIYPIFRILHTRLDDIDLDNPPPPSEDESPDN